MTKELIKMETETISNNQITIKSESTIFCDMERISYPDIKELEKEVKQLRRTLKDQGTKLNRTDTLKTLKEEKLLYNSMVKEYNYTFDQLVEEWESKLQQGIYRGYTNDKDINEVINPLQSKLKEFNYHSTLLTKIKEIEQKVIDIKNDLSYGQELYSVAI